MEAQAAAPVELAIVVPKRVGQGEQVICDKRLSVAIENGVGHHIPVRIPVDSKYLPLDGIRWYHRISRVARNSAEICPNQRTIQADAHSEKAMTRVDIRFREVSAHNQSIMGIHANRIGNGTVKRVHCARHVPSRFVNIDLYAVELARVRGSHICLETNSEVERIAVAMNRRQIRGVCDEPPVVVPRPELEGIADIRVGPQIPIADGIGVDPRIRIVGNLLEIASNVLDGIRLRSRQTCPDLGRLDDPCYDLNIQVLRGNPTPNGIRQIPNKRTSNNKWIDIDDVDGEGRIFAAILLIGIGEDGVVVATGVARLIPCGANEEINMRVAVVVRDVLEMANEGVIDRIPGHRIHDHRIKVNHHRVDPVDEQVLSHGVNRRDLPVPRKQPLTGSGIAPRAIGVRVGRVIIVDGLGELHLQIEGISFSIAETAIIPPTQILHRRRRARIGIPSRHWVCRFYSRPVVEFRIDIVNIQVGKDGVAVETRDAVKSSHGNKDRILVVKVNELNRVHAGADEPGPVPHVDELVVRALGCRIVPVIRQAAMIDRIVRRRIRGRGHREERPPDNPLPRR